MAAVDFTDDEEESSGVDFTPDQTPVAQAPRPIIEPPSEIAQTPSPQQAYGAYAYVPQRVASPAATVMSPYGLQVTERGQFEPNIPFDPSKALVPLSKLALTPEEVEAGMEKVVSPFLSEQDRRALMEAPLTASPLAKATAGLTQGAYRTAESLTSPMNLGLLGGTAGVSQIPAAARLISGAFAADMARQVPEMARNLGEAVASKDPEAIARTATELAATGAFTTAAGTHAVGPRAAPMVTLPETMRELAKEPSTTGVPSAIQERQTTETIRGLPEQPGVHEPLPAQEGAGGIPPSGISPRDAQGARVAEEARAAEVPLTAKEVTVKAHTPAGDEISLKMDAGEAQRRFTQRKTVLEALRDCMGRT